MFLNNLVQFVIIFKVFSLINCFKCPSDNYSITDNLTECFFCSQKHSIHYKLPNLTKVNYDTLELTKSHNENEKFNSSKCYNLTVLAQSVNEEQDKGNDYKTLKLTGFNETMIKLTFDECSNISLNELIIKQFEAEELSLDFEKLSLVKNISIGGEGSENRITRVVSNSFSELKLLKYLSLSWADIKVLDENSLVFSSNETIFLDLSHNLITTNELQKSNLLNRQGGLIVDLSNNNITEFPAHIFERFCKSDQDNKINLAHNPIECYYGKINWIYRYDLVNTTEKVFSNVNCSNLDNRDIFTIEPGDFPHEQAPDTVSSYLHWIILPFGIAIVSGILARVYFYFRTTGGYAALNEEQEPRGNPGPIFMDLFDDVDVDETTFDQSLIRPNRSRSINVEVGDDINDSISSLNSQKDQEMNTL